MAYTKIIVIHSRLDRCLGYTQDEEKTSLETVLDYAMNRDKTEQDCFETALNCDRETAYADMMDQAPLGQDQPQTQGLSCDSVLCPR